MELEQLTETYCLWEQLLSWIFISLFWGFSQTENCSWKKYSFCVVTTFMTHDLFQLKIHKEYNLCSLLYLHRCLTLCFTQQVHRHSFLWACDLFVCFPWWTYLAIMILSWTKYHNVDATFPILKQRFTIDGQPLSHCKHNCFMCSAFTMGTLFSNFLLDFSSYLLSPYICHFQWSNSPPCC